MFSKINEIDDIYDLVAFTTKLVDTFVQEECYQTIPEMLGLNKKACNKIYVSKDLNAIIIPKSCLKEFEKWAEFEYIERNYRHVVGNYVIYTIDLINVQDAIDEFVVNREKQECH